MAAKEARRYRNMLLTMMGQITIDQYGEEALDHLMTWRYDRIKKDWQDIAETPDEPIRNTCIVSSPTRSMNSK